MCGEGALHSIDNIFSKLLIMTMFPLKLPKIINVTKLPIVKLKQKILKLIEKTKTKTKKKKKKNPSSDQI
jgi:hypothetical protein